MTAVEGTRLCYGVIWD